MEPDRLPAYGGRRSSPPVRLRITISLCEWGPILPAQLGFPIDLR